MKPNLNELLTLAINAAELAAAQILEVYHSGDFQEEAKGDNSPLTRADKKAHTVICNTLKSSEFPVLSEEGRSILFEERKDWEYFWMVDPLDGTKEFIKRNDEFTVNIALIHRDHPVLGVVVVPVTGDTYYATAGHGAFLKKGNHVTKLAVRSPIDMRQAGLRVVASRSHMNKSTEQFITNLDKATLVSAGSSLKFMLLAEGKADIYPRFGPTMEWDTAAAQIIVEEVGMRVTQHGSDEAVVYNKADLLNPDFMVA